MRVYWQEAKQGLRLVLLDGEREERIGGVRETKQGFDAFAITFGYDPDRAGGISRAWTKPRRLLNRSGHGSSLPVTRSFPSRPT